MSILDTLVYHYLNQSGYKKAAKELKHQGCSTEPVDITLEEVVESYNEGKKLKKLITLLASAKASENSSSEDDTSESSGSDEERVYIVDEDDENGTKDNDVQLIEYVTDYPTEDVEITSESSSSSSSSSESENDVDSSSVSEDSSSSSSSSSSDSSSDDEPVYHTVKRRKTRNYPEPSYTDPSDSSSSDSNGDEICVSASDSETSTTTSEEESSETSDGTSSGTSSSSSSDEDSDSECDGCKYQPKMYTLESSPKKHRHHHNTPFQRVKATEMDDLHPLMRDLSYKKQKELGATTGYGETANKNMFKTRGKSFNKLKQKYKNSYRGGRIDPSTVHSHKLL